jgi:hypothetical protein
MLIEREIASDGRTWHLFSARNYLEQKTLSPISSMTSVTFLG